MQPQAIDEALVHRQHVRLKVAIQVEVDGVRYQVDDWSIGGFGVESVMISRAPPDRFPVRVIFPFEEFEISMRLEARMVYANQDQGRFGCAFVDCSREQVAVLRYLVGASLSGEVASAGDILRIRQSEQVGEVRPERNPEPARPIRAGPRWLGHLALVAGLALLAAVLTVLAPPWLRDLPRGARSYTGVVEAPIALLRAPATGRFEGRLAAGEAAGPGTVVGSLETAEAGVLPLESACRCVVLETLARDGQTYRAGEPLMALVEVDRPLMIRAPAPIEALNGLRPGRRVEIRSLAGERGVDYGQIAGIDVRPGMDALRRGASGLPLAEAQAQVLIRPDRPLAPEDFGRLVAVRLR